MRSFLFCRAFLRPATGVALLLLATVLVTCTPVEGGPPDMGEVEAHLHLGLGFIPDGCEPAGLGGDGRERVFSAGLDCQEGTTLVIERLDPVVSDDPLPAVPGDVDDGRVEWRPEVGGDAIRVVSAGLDADVLLQVAQSIQVHDR